MVFPGNHVVAEGARLQRLRVDRKVRETLGGRTPIVDRHLDMLTLDTFSQYLRRNVVVLMEQLPKDANRRRLDPIREQPENLGLPLRSQSRVGVALDDVLAA